MSATLQQLPAVSVRLAIAVLAVTAWAGCDMGLDQPANRYERLNQEMKKLLAELRQVTDEATANEHRAAIEAAATSIRDVQDAIIEVETKKKGTGMGRITNFSHAKQWQQISFSVRRQVERIREADVQAGSIVDTAIAGVIFPEDSGL